MSKNSRQERIGNTILYLCDKMGPTSKTKLIKLLYFLEEASYRKTGTPFLGLDYEVWIFGPVSRELYKIICDAEVNNNDWLFNYVNVIPDKKNPDTTFIEKKNTVAFNDDEFSDNDMALLDEVIKVYGKMNVKKIVKEAHKEDSLWYKIAKENNLLEKFENKELTTSNYKIPFLELIRDDTHKMERYESFKEFIEFAQQHS